MSDNCLRRQSHLASLIGHIHICCEPVRHCTKKLSAVLEQRAELNNSPTLENFVHHARQHFEKWLVQIQVYFQKAKLDNASSSGKILFDPSNLLDRDAITRFHHCLQKAELDVTSFLERSCTISQTIRIALYTVAITSIEAWRTSNSPRDCRWPIYCFAPSPSRVRPVSNAFQML